MARLDFYHGLDGVLVVFLSQKGLPDFLQRESMCDQRPGSHLALIEKADGSGQVPAKSAAYEGDIGGGDGRRAPAKGLFVQPDDVYFPTPVGDL